MPVAIVRIGGSNVKFNLACETIKASDLIQYVKKACKKLVRGRDQILNQFEAATPVLLFGSSTDGVMRWRASTLDSCLALREHPMFRVVFIKVGEEPPKQNEEWLTAEYWFNPYKEQESPQTSPTVRRDTVAPSTSTDTDKTVEGVDPPTNSEANMTANTLTEERNMFEEQVLTDNGGENLDEEDMENSFEEGEENREEDLEKEGQKRNQGTKLPKQYPLPEWSPILAIEIKEGRLIEEQNKIKLRQEAAMGLVRVVGLFPAQGAYIEYAKRLLKEIPELSVMADSSIKPYSLLASQISKYIRTQRAALEERRQAQKVRESRLISQAVIGQNVTGEADLRKMLEELIKNPQINLNKALSFIEKTFNLRQQIKFANYKELLKAHSFLLRHPKILSKEIGMHYPQIGTEGAGNNFEVMLAKLAAMQNINCPEDDKGKIELLIEIQVKLQQERFVKKTKFRPIALTEVDSHQKNVHFDTSSFRPFSLNVLCCGQTISNVLLMGDKEIVYKFDDMTALNCLELFVLSHKALDTAVAQENAYFFHFLNHVLFNQELPVGVRYPMKRLHDFLSTYKTM